MFDRFPTLLIINEQIEYLLIGRMITERKKDQEENIPEAMYRCRIPGFKGSDFGVGFLMIWGKICLTSHRHLPAGR